MSHRKVQNEKKIFILKIAIKKVKKIILSQTQNVQRNKAKTHKIHVGRTANAHGVCMFAGGFKKITFERDRYELSYQNILDNINKH